MSAQQSLGAEYQVRLPGPWDGPVRVVERTPTFIRLATLDGHTEAGHIEFRTGWGTSSPSDDGQSALEFEIHTLARRADRLFHLLNNRLPPAREMQLHMWVHFCRRVAELADGTVTCVNGAVKTPFS